MRPDVVLIMVGANDVTHRIERTASVRQLEQTVRRIRALGSEVVVGTCPDLGTIQPIRQPLRALLQRWSRDLAAAQTVAVVEAGGRTVSLGDLLGPEFARSPHEMFSKDRFHPSAAGYARAAAALLPSVCAALGVWGADTNGPAAGAAPWRGRRPGRRGRGAGRQGARHRGVADPDRRAVAWSARPVGGHPAAPARPGPTGGGHPGRDGGRGRGRDGCRLAERRRSGARDPGLRRRPGQPGSSRASPRFTPEPSPSHRNGSGAKVKVPGSGGKVEVSRRRRRRARPRPSSAGRSGPRRRPWCSPGGSRRRSRRAPSTPRRPPRRRRR